ncbi:MAG: hypothetical protein M3P01_14575 [Actinomycetota bacterium]|nr:hypothetical protein [Actinomycetota bacterium]
MTVDERTVGAVLHRMADEVEWKPGLPRRTLFRARARRSTTVALTVLLLGGLGYGGALVAHAFTSPQRSAAQQESGKIAFAGPDGIYVINADGNHVRRITQERGDVSPSWSPDGKRIAFERDIRGRQDVYVIDSDGSHLRRLTSDGRSGSPAWSPTGTTIAFAREFPTRGHVRERIRIFVMRSDGTQAQPATSASSLQYETSPAWSPDGTRIAFTGFRTRRPTRPAPVGHIYVVTPGGRPARVGTASGDATDPVWGPDGQSLLFVNGGPKGGAVATMTTTGSNLRFISSDPGLTYSPAWSPDGRSIVFARGPNSTATRLYTYNLEDGRIHLLTPASLKPAIDPSWWSPKPSVAPSPTTSPQVHREELLATARTPVPSGITDVAVGADAVWVTGFGTLTRVDPASGRIVASIALRGLGDFSSVAVGAGSVWVTASETGFRGVYKIDPATNAIADRIPLSRNVLGITVGAGSVWVTRTQMGLGKVIRIDAHTDRVIGKPISVGVGPGPILYAAGVVWVTNSDNGGSVSKVDPSTGSVVRTWGVAPNVEAFGSGSLWGVGPNQIVRIDVHSGRELAETPLTRAAKVAFEDGRVWAITAPRSKSRTLYIPDPRHPGTVVTIDPATNELSSHPVPYGKTAAYIAVRGAVAWIGDYNRQLLTRVEARRK